MALIQLHKPGDARGNQLTYLDLTTGRTGHLNTLGDFRGLPGYANTGILATGVDLKLNVAPISKSFDKIRYRDAKKAEDDFTETSIADLAVAARDKLLIKVGSDNDARFFKVYVRGTPFHERDRNPAFRSEESTLEFEELVRGRMIWPLTVVLADNILTVLNLETQSRRLGPKTNELMFCLRPESYRTDVLDGPASELREPATPATVFYNNPFPIAKIEFMQPAKRTGELRAVDTPWIENVEIAARFSKGYVNSTYLIRVNEAGRQDLENNTYKFTAYLVDRALSIEDWDPEVVIDEHD